MGRHAICRFLCLALLAASLTGCGLFRDDTVIRGQGPSLKRELARLPDLDLEPKQSVAELIASETDVLAAYRAVYGKVEDPQQNQVLGKRLADLTLAQAEELSADGSVAQPYASAVELYEGLLANMVDDEGRDKLLYQLAQSHDLAGNAAESERHLDELINRFPESPYVLEAHFRRAEMRFSQGRYAQAAADYGQVTAVGDATKYWLHASYMLGWSHFKESDLPEAAREFYRVVELTAEADAAGEAATVRQRAQQELLDDALRVLMLTLNYQDGVQSLAADMVERGKPEWQYPIYERLAQDYLKQERYLDGVAAWQVFVDENPLDLRAPYATVGMIDILAEADFPSEILPKKVEYVERYGVRSEFWQAHEADDRAGYMPTLREYLDELSQLRHAEAQRSRSSADYMLAADYYEQTIAAFPDDAKTGDTLYLLGDVYTDAGRVEASLAAYQRLVQDFPEHAQAPDAGYAALLALGTLAETAPAAERDRWATERLTAQIDFAMVFPDDTRAPTVQTAAADTLFKQGNYPDAIQLSEQLLASRTDLDATLRSTAQLIIGHGSMELGQYVAAEQAYTQYLAGDAVDAAERSGVQEQLLASVYKQGEAAEQRQDTATALTHYLRIADLAPGSELAATAHYDAVAMVETAGAFDQVAELLQSFRSRYPSDQRVAEVPARLAGLFEKQQNYAAAADEYLNVAATSADSEQRRQAHYLAAQLYLKDGDKQIALREFARYTESYPEPWDVHMAALDVQDTLLEEQGGSRLSLWKQKVAVHSRAGNNATERMNYLAAEASLQLADIDRAKFDALRLTQPLKRSLKAKQRSLKGTVDAYQRVVAFGVADFVTAANFQIADMYVALSRSIMDSDRPAGLSALELEQYEILLEEQAYPFEEQAIELHEVNLRRMWQGSSDQWTERSLGALRVLMPGRFDKNEVQVAYVDAIH